MHNKGIIKVFAVLLALVSVYQLSFTFLTSKAESNADTYAKQEVSSDKENYADLRQDARSHYLDSLENEPVFAGITYKTAKGKQINEGLDLKGGVSVILQISVKDLLKELSDDSDDPAFQKALSEADDKMKESQDTYANLFFDAFEDDPDAKLADPDIFGNKKMSGQISTDMSNSEVERVLQKRIDESISSAFEVLNKRIDKFGVAQPDIQRLGDSGRILVELPGAEDVSRVKSLLKSTAQLEFWHVYQKKDFGDFLQKADTKISELNNTDEAETEEKAETDSTQADTTEAQKEDEDLEELLKKKKEENDSVSESEEAENQIDEDNHPLLGLMQVNGRDEGPILGQFYVKDTAAVNEMLKNSQVRSLLPSDMRYARFAWGIPDEDTNLVGLYALKSNKENEADLTGSVVTDAKQTYDEMGNVAVSMDMNGKGSKKWEEMTGKAYKQGTQIAIVLDNTVYSAPGVTSGPISGGKSQITGDFSINEGKDLSTVLKAGKLPASADIVQIEIVGPTLGHEAIQSGIISFIVALLIVMGYMIFYYGKAGIFADIALAANLLFIFGILAGLGAVLTLPGIAGIVLTIGMAVDANVLIFDRIREELRLGKSQLGAIKDGFKNALSSILDANITTALTGLVLFVFGSGPVKGFATTLLIGIATSLFSAIFITRLFIDGYGKNGKTLNFATTITKHWWENFSYNFTNKRKIVYGISGLAIVISIISLSTRGLNQGVDFLGGRTYNIRFDKEVDAPKIEDELTETFGSAEAKTYGSQNQIKVTTKYKVDEHGEDVDEEVMDKLYTTLKPNLPDDLNFDDFKKGKGENGIGVMSSIKVGPTIAEDIKRDALWAVLGSLVAIFLYILFRFRKWQFSLGATLALVHDAVILLGIYSLFYGIAPFSMEIGQSFIAGILTVIGYSINDTVVVFDRIREYFREHPSWGLKRNINASISSTLERSVNTSLTTFLVLLTIFLFGAESIRGFIFSIMVGVIVGTYSSIFVASPLMYEATKNKEDEVLGAKEEEDKKPRDKKTEQKVAN